MGRTTLGAKFKRPYLCEIESYGSDIWQAMTSLSVVLSDSQARPFPKMPASCAAGELMPT